MRTVIGGLALAIAMTASAADKVKVGFISTLSGPNASIGSDIRDGFNLAVKMNGGKLGGLPAEVLIGDDQLKPENAKQLAERYLRLEKVDFLTGGVFSNIVIAIAPDAIANKVFYISPNAGPAQFTGANMWFARGPRVWMLRATISLPTPLSPVMRTLASVRATRSISCRRSLMTGLTPIN